MYVCACGWGGRSLLFLLCKYTTHQPFGLAIYLFTLRGDINLQYRGREEKSHRDIDFFLLDGGVYRKDPQHFPPQLFPPPLPDRAKALGEFPLPKSNLIHN